MRKVIFGIIACGILLFFSFISLGIWLVLFAPDLNSTEYYLDDKNYDSFECKVSSFNVYDDVICFELEHSQDNYYETFKICGKNFDLAIKNGLSEILRENVVFTISSANAYRGDGWSYPVVALKYNNEDIIPFAEGKQNYVEYQQQAENRAERYLLIAGGVFAFLIIAEICLIILCIKSGKTHKA